MITHYVVLIAAERADHARPTFLWSVRALTSRKRALLAKNPAVAREPRLLRAVP